MSRWSRAELAEAFASYQATVAQCAASGDWSPFADMFTEDATYAEHAYGGWQGRERTRAWVVRTMTTFPGNAMVAFPAAWHAIDEEQGWVVCDVRNLMRDPGDGSVHEASNITILRYTGEGLWSSEEDAYNPMAFVAMATKWCRVAEANSCLPEDARAWLVNYGAKAEH